MKILFLFRYLYTFCEGHLGCIRITRQPVVLCFHSITTDGLAHESRSISGRHFYASTASGNLTVNGSDRDPCEHSPLTPN